MATQPRVTRFKIEWDDPKANGELNNSQNSLGGEEEMNGIEQQHFGIGNDSIESESEGLLGTKMAGMLTGGVDVMDQEMTSDSLIDDL